jgi:hypothetical protein
VSKITTHLNFDQTNEIVICRDTRFNFAKNRGIYRECLELETTAGNSAKYYWLKQPFNVANTINASRWQNEALVAALTS